MTLKVLFLDHALALGGAERSLLLLLKHLDRTRWKPHLACAGGPLAEQAIALGVPVHQAPMPRLRRSPRAPLNWLIGALAIARLAQEIDAALLIANTVRSALYASLAARLARCPFVWHMRDFWLSESRPRRLWADGLGKRLLCATATRVIANSRATAAHLPCPGKVVVVYNGIEVERFDPSLDGEAFRAAYGIPLSASLVGMVGRLRPWKGQDRFLRVLARIRQDMPDVWGVIVGGSPFEVQDDYPRRLERLTAELDLRDRLVFTGHLEDVRPALAAMDVFVHPGDPEPFGLVNLEAMAMGRPVVAFAHGALPEIVADGETGILIPPGDEGRMADAAGALLQDSTRREVMGQAARARVEERFTADRMAQAVTRALEDLLLRTQ
ncbi:MAG: glycosyltransferase family 4 protein [Chloroflexi bacterium]|nr:glycosyltransferase family 4 protein [Chloroflexota bacterium]